MKRRFLTALLAILTVLSLVACGEPTESSDNDYAIQVQVAYPGKTVSTPADSVYVQPGEDVYFPVTVNEGYEYVGNDMGAEYVDGVLILRNVRYPTTITVQLKQKEGDSYYHTQEGGTVTLKTDDGLPVFDEPVTLAAEPMEGYSFLGWTEGGYLTEQGTLVGEETEYTCMLSTEKPVYANFKSEAEAIVCYHLNGGTAEGTHADVYYDTFPIGYYYYPNAIGDVGTFNRSGYTLVEYSENPDGSGFVTCPGGKIFIETDEVIHLWLQWEEWSDASLFKISKRNNGYYIDEYTGTENIVVVPGIINGNKIVGISSGAFTKRKMETLIMHKDIQVIEDEAIKDCSFLSTFYLHDTIAKLSNNIMSGCSAFKNFRYNAARAPSRCNQSWGAYTRKFERVVYLAGQEHNSLVILSGSSSLYATDSPLLEQLMADGGYDFDVVNFGIQASVPQAFYMEFIYHFMDEGDIVIQAPETGATMGTAISETQMGILQSTYNAFRYVDISNYSNLFGAIQSTNNTRAKSTDTTYEAERSDSVTINLYGDRENEHKTGIANGYKPGSMTVGSGSLRSVELFNKLYRRFKGKGVRVYYSFAPMAGGAFKSSDDDIKAYEDSVDNKLSAPRISDLKNYIIPQEYMYNSDWHTNVEGMILRTNQLAKDILAQFEKEGK